MTTLSRAGAARAWTSSSATSTARTRWSPTAVRLAGRRRHFNAAARHRADCRRRLAEQQQETTHSTSCSAIPNLPIERSSALTAGAGRARPGRSATSTTPCCARRSPAPRRRSTTSSSAASSPAGTPVLSVIDDSAPWVDANPKETDITYLRDRPEGRRSTSTRSPTTRSSGTVVAVSPGTGAQFSILPAQNASGNWVKVVQRVPVRIAFDQGEDTRDLRSGMSVTVEIDTGRQTAFARELLGLTRRKAAEQANDRALLAAADAGRRTRGCMLTSVRHDARPSCRRSTPRSPTWRCPTCRARLSASLDQINWVLTSYIVAAADHDRAGRLAGGSLRPQDAVHHLRRSASPSRRCCARSRRTSSRWCCSACCRAWAARRWCRCRNP